MVGQRFGILTVIESGGRNSRGRRIWICKCDCGTTKCFRHDHLNAGLSKSCGCVATSKIVRQSTRHGQATRGHVTPEYRAWQAMRKRCEDAQCKAFKWYGARGIRVCERWQTFENFIRDMRARPSAKHSLDRIDVNGNYEPGNCRWATWREQQNNRSNNRKIVINGESMTANEWSRRTGTKQTTIRRRLQLGWTAFEAVYGRTKAA